MLTLLSDDRDPTVKIAAGTLMCSSPVPDVLDGLTLEEI